MFLRLIKTNLKRKQKTDIQIVYNLKNQDKCCFLNSVGVNPVSFLKAV